MTNTERLRLITCFLMIIACILHLIQLFIYPIEPKYFITLIGAIGYAIASIGLYQDQKYGYYITICFPIVGVIFVGVFALLGLSNELGYGELNPFTLIAAFLEIPAIILSIYILKKEN